MPAVPPILTFLPIKTLFPNLTDLYFLRNFCWRFCVKTCRKPCVNQTSQLLKPTPETKQRCGGLAQAITIRRQMPASERSVSESQSDNQRLPSTNVDNGRRVTHQPPPSAPAFCEKSYLFYNRFSASILDLILESSWSPTGVLFDHFWYQTSLKFYTQTSLEYKTATFTIIRKRTI